MRREEAIKIMKNYPEWHHFHESEEKAFRMGLKALEQEPCEDAISRQAAIKAAMQDVNDKRTNGFIAGATRAANRIKLLPPVNPQPKTGHWIRWYEQKEYKLYIDNIPHYKCSECGKEYDPHSSQFIKYCNECGAKMVDLPDTNIGKMTEIPTGSEPQESEG